MKPLEGHLDQAAPRGASVAVFSVGTWKTLTLSGQVLIRIDQAGTRGPKGLPLPVSSCPIRPSAMLAALPKRLVCHVPPSTPMLWWAVPAVRTVTHRDQRRPAAHRLLRHLEPVALRKEECVCKDRTALQVHSEQGFSCLL